MTTYSRSLWAASVLAPTLVLFSACSTPDPAPAPVSAPLAAAPGLRPGAADASLTTAEYVQAGVPDPARPWTGQDLGQAVRALEELAKRSPAALPRHASPRSGALFARLTSTADLEPLGTREGTLEQRARAALPFLEAALPLARLYETALEQGSASSDDLIQVIGWQLQCIAAVLGVGAEAAQRLDPEDPEQAADLQRFAQARATAGHVVTATIADLGAVDITPDERRGLLAQLQAALPSILPVVTPETQRALVSSLRELDADPARADLDPDLGLLIDESERAAAASPLDLD